MSLDLPAPADLESLLGRLASARVAVIGDLCLDLYWELELARSEKSVETGAATLPVRQMRVSLGGAGNLCANLKALGVGQVAAFGAVGDDAWGRELRRHLGSWGIQGEACIEPGEGYATLAYAKTYDGPVERSRHDFGNFNRLPDEDARRLLTLLEGRIGEFQAVAVNEQVPEGLHTPCFRAGLARLMEEHPQTLFLVDSRHHSDAYPSAWLKLNDSEALRLCGMGEEGGLGRERVLAAARSLFRKRARPVFITRGARGILLWDARGPREIPGLRPEGAIDTVGAGDSALAGIAAGLACGASADEAAWLGNLCAAVTIRKLRQTGTATPREILESARTAVPERQIDLADAPQRARFLPGTDFEVAEELPPDFRPTHAIFDHDGTISTLREGWEGVMEPMMIRAILGPDAEKAEPGLFRRVQERTREFIDRSTGIQTLAQMRGLVDLVREFGRVPEGEILDMHGYKEIYNRALMERVDERRSRLERGEFSPEDFTLKNAISFLEWLHRRGVRLYLASGTDEADVKREASALGYDRLFEGRIYGASGDVAHEAKRQVLERLLGELGPEALRGVVTFGDGPVELRETRRLGGQAIGLCSDEKRRYGINPEKRSRLVRAGAQILIPDYSRLDALTALLHL